jgi:hypothetical protein
VTSHNLSRNIDAAILFVIAGDHVKLALPASCHYGLMVMMSPFLITALLSP